jgi:hypothetical protein
LARLVIVTHEFDEFARWPGLPWGRKRTPYTLHDVLRHFEAMGHSWRVSKGPNAVPGDAALLHVDCTFVGEEYLALRSRYERTINFAVSDSSKRTISRLLLKPGDCWDGRVIVKSNLNYRGILEDTHNRRAARAGRLPPHPGVRRTEQYLVLDSIEQVEDDIWNDPDLVVERFLPEVDDDGGFVIRTWVFMGSRERCTRMVTPTWIGKAGNAIRFEADRVPEPLRAERARLNFDYGKFDFVMHRGEPVLLDANRTPGSAKRIESVMKAGARNLAEGLDELIRAASSR